jgi:L-threonylcarbamoyladenylate synthase
MITEEELDRAADLIRAGRLVAFPTETVYGLGANALDPAAVDRIFQAKGRPATSPLIVHVASAEMARSVVRVWPDSAAKLVKKFWPGPLTIVLPKHPSVPDRVTAGLSTVGVRMPSNPLALALIERAGVPIAAPSANRFTQLSPTTAEHVRSGLGDRVDLVLDDGPTEVGIESTVLSLASSGDPVLLRPGAITQHAIEAVIGPVRIIESANGAHPSPGMHQRHYSPRTRLLITDSPPRGHGVYLWSRTPRQGVSKSLRMPDNAQEYARQLYATLHALDGDGWDYIAVEPVPDSAEWAGVRDRLKRAAATDPD